MAESPLRRAEGVLADNLFLAPAESIDTSRLFAVSESMRAFAETRVVPRFVHRGRFLGLYEAILEELRLDYDASVTRGAADTFEARSGNCLSLVILTAALAREYGVPFQYHEARTAGAWSRHQDLLFNSGHVNLALGPHGTWRQSLGTDAALVVDFVAPNSPAHISRRPIEETTIAAMYANNRAAETLAAGDVVTAYWWARAAILSDPTFTTAFNTLGVIYRRHGHLPEAERALRLALAREPESMPVLSNLQGVLARQGRRAEAEEIRARLTTVAPYPPFHFYDQGLAAAARGDYEAAIDLFRRELARMPYSDEVHFALAVAQLQRGKLGQARRHVALAVENSISAERRQIYAAKLGYLQSLRN